MRALAPHNRSDNLWHYNGTCIVGNGIQIEQRNSTNNYQDKNSSKIRWN